MAAMSARAVAAVRDWSMRLASSSVPDPTYAVVSHGDVIKAIVADALGMHLDDFQRISVDPCSVTVIRYTELRPFVVRVNDVGGDLSGLVAPPPTKRRRSTSSSDAVVGGGAGS
jgi:broad specificity phosphatase PhoE